jgi:hypothetical protein
MRGVAPFMIVWCVHDEPEIDQDSHATYYLVQVVGTQ